MDRPALAIRLLPLLLPLGARAQEGAGSAPPQEPEEVRVRAKREEERRVEPPRTRKDLSREELARSGAWNVLDALRDLWPSFFTSRRSVLGYGLAAGAGGVVSIRGVGGKPNAGVLVTIDGVPSRASLFGHPLQDLYLPEALDRAALVAGGASDIHGGSALGGVVELTTRRRRTEGFETELAARIARYDTHEESLAHGGKTGAFDYFVTGGYRSTDGHRENSRFRQTHGTLRLGAELGPGYAAWIHLRAAQLAAEDPFQAASGLLQHVSRRGCTLALEEETAEWDGRAAVFYEWGDHAFTDGFDSEDWTQGFSLWRAREIAAGVRLAAGVDATRYGGRIWSMSRAVDRGKHDLTEASVFGRASARLGAGLEGTAGLRATKVSDLDPVLLPSLGLAWREEGEGWRRELRTGWSRSFRAPTLNELHFPFPAYDPDLDPERADTAELAGKAGQRLWEAEVVLFAIKGRDAVVRQGPPPPFGIENSGDFLHHGVETSLRVGTDRLGATGGAAWLEHDRISPGAFHYRFLWGIHGGSGRVPEGEWEWLVRLAGETVLDLYGEPGSRSAGEDFSRLSVTATVTPWTGLELLAGVENLADARWHEIGNLPVPGRTAWAGLRARF